jgi:RecB family exonuclease
VQFSKVQSTATSVYANHAQHVTYAAPLTTYIQVKATTREGLDQLQDSSIAGAELQMQKCIGQQR